MEQRLLKLLDLERYKNSAQGALCKPTSQTGRKQQQQQQQITISHYYCMADIMHIVLLLIAISCAQLAHQQPLRRNCSLPTEAEGTNQTASASGMTTDSEGGNMTEIYPRNATGNDTLGESELDKYQNNNNTENGSSCERFCEYDNRTHNIHFDCNCEGAEVRPTARWSVLVGLVALKDYSTELYTARAENFVACLEPVRHRTPGGFDFHSPPELSHRFVAQWMRVFRSYAGYVASLIAQGGASLSEEEQLISLYQMMSGILNDYAIVVS